MKLAGLDRQVIDKIGQMRYDRIIEKHEGPERWQQVTPMPDKVPAAKIIARMLEEDPAMAEEFVLDQMERLILAKVEKRVIAQIMGVNVSTVYLWGKMAAKRRQEQYDSMPAWIVPGFAGDVLYTYEKIKQLGFQMIYEEGASHYKQMQGIRILFRAQQAIVDYQTKLGLYDDKSKLLPPRPDAGAEYQQAEYQQAERKHFPIADLLRLEQIIQSAADQNIQDQEDIHSQCLDEKFPEQNIVDFVSQMSREASGSQQSARKAPTAA